MQEQNFEKQVRQKMEELSFTPSEPVWQNIEEQLKNKKDRRRILLWLWLLSAAVAGSVWYMLTMNGTAEKAILSKQMNPQPAPGRSITINTHSNNTIQNNIVSQHTKEKKFIATIAFENKKPVQNVQQKNIYSKPLLTITKNISAKHSNIVSSNTETYNPEAAANDNQKETPTNQSYIAAPVQYLIKTEILHTLTDSLKIMQPVPKVEATNIVQQNKYENRKRLLLEWSASFGVSGISEGLFNFSGAKSMADYAQQIPNSSTTPNASLNQLPAPVTNGLSFSAGAHLKYKIGNRTAFFTGLQYHYFSTHINVGVKVQDSSGSGFNASSYSSVTYYRNNSRSVNYTNQYHLIEVPAGVELQLLKKKQLFVRTGFSVAQLLYSNAVHYHYNTQLYYRDNSLLKKTGLYWFGDATYSVWKDQKFSLQAGPYLNFGLSNLTKNTASPNQHLFATGMTVYFSLK